MTVLGIDPGLGGAVAVLTLTTDGAQELGVVATPVVHVKTGKGTSRREYDVPAMWALLSGLPPIAFCLLELQGARPGQGRSSMLKIGLGQGLWEGLLVARGIGFRRVTAPTWRQMVGLRGVDKGGVGLAAARRFPRVHFHGDGGPDAAMLALAAALEQRARLEAPAA